MFLLGLTERLTPMFTARIAALAPETRDLLLLLALDGSGQALSAASVVGPDAAEDALTGLLRQAQDADLLEPGVEPRLEATALLAMPAGGRTRSARTVTT
jgi:hypothetical protein